MGRKGLQIHRTATPPRRPDVWETPPTSDRHRRPFSREEQTPVTVERGWCSRRLRRGTGWFGEQRTMYLGQRRNGFGALGKSW